jgi:hypothetical protein
MLYFTRQLQNLALIKNPPKIVHNTKTWCWINLSAGMMALQRSQGIGFFVCVLFLGGAAPPEVSTSSGAAA